MSEQDSQRSPRAVVKQRLAEDLDRVEQIDVQSAILCGEMGCGEREQEYVLQHPDLRCPYMDRVEEPQEYCKRLRDAYQAATGSTV